MSHKYYYVNVSSEQSASTIMRNEKILHSIIRWQCLQLNSFLWQVQIYASLRSTTACVELLLAPDKLLRSITAVHEIASANCTVKRTKPTFYFTLLV